MERKLVRQGNSTLMVSLPNAWVKKTKLYKGAEVSISENENGLIVSKTAITNKKTATITLTSDAEPSVRTAIINAYRSGCDKIKVIFKRKPQHKLVSEIINKYTIGLEVVEHGKDYLLLENITEPDAEQFDVLLNKIFYNISQLIECTEERLRGKAVVDYENIVLKIHQYDNFCRRVVSKRNEPSSQAGFYHAFFTLIAQGQRELYHLNKYLDENEVKLKDFRMLLHLKEVVNLLRQAYAQKDLTLIEKIHNLKRDLRYTMFYPLIENGKKKENVVIYHTASSLRLFYLACSPLTGLLVGNQRNCTD